MRGNLNNVRRIALWNIVFVLIFASVFAVPQNMNVHGRLTNPAGIALEGTYNIRFRIYDVPTGGTALFDQTSTVTTDEDGVYSVTLNNVDLDFSQQYYLGITVESDAEMTPRINMTTSPYSYRANVSSGLECTDCVDGSDLADTIILDANLSIDSGTFFIDKDNNRVGIGTVSPISLLSLTNGIITLGQGANDKAELRGGTGYGASLRLFEGISGTETIRLDAGGAGGTSWLTSGNVGIGTTNPLTSLYVNDTDGTGAIIFVENTLGRYAFGVDTSGGYIQTANSLNFSFLGGTNRAIFIEGSNGNVGIGTTTPSQKLDVAGNMNVSGSGGSDPYIYFGKGGYIYDNGTAVIIGHN